MASNNLLHRCITCLLVAGSLGQEALTLPPPCPRTGPFVPGDPAPAFLVPLTSGINLTVPSGVSLPLVIFSVDAVSDPGGVLLATDSIEIDRMLAEEPPLSGTLLFLSQSTSGGGADLQRIFEARLALQPPERAAAWRNHLAFAAPTLDALRVAGSALATLLDGWQSPRLWLEAPPPDAIMAPRVDGFYECFMWPSAQAAYQLVGPFTACDPKGLNGTTVPSGSLMLVMGVTAEGGSCPAGEAAAWAQTVGPAAAGAVLSAPAPQIVGRNCDDTFVDDLFYPMVISSLAGVQFAAKLNARPNTALNVSINFSCSTGTWIAIDADGRLSPVGWRKYTEASALRWAVDHLVTLGATARRSASASLTYVLAPPNSTVTSFSANVTFPSLRALRLAAAAQGASFLDFSLRCAGIGDNACGPWDRIIFGTAQCWDASAPAPLQLPQASEFARWITPFRRSTGRWLTPADVLLGLIGNGSTTPGPDGPDAAWTCRIAVWSGGEPWLGSLSLVLNTTADAAESEELDAPLSSLAPISSRYQRRPGTAPIASLLLDLGSFEMNFTTGFNDNRTALVVAPHTWNASASGSSVALYAWITGHGSAPPPPVSQGCEYAPTSHEFRLFLQSDGNRPIAIANSTDIAYDQYMLAGSMFGCSSKATLGVIANQHGDYRDGRDGWCPGQAVQPLAWDVTAAFVNESLAGIPRLVNYSALSYYVGGGHPSSDGCKGVIVMNSSLVFYAAVTD